MNLFSKINFLRDSSGNKYWQSRISAELLYLYCIFKGKNISFDNDIIDNVNYLIDRLNTNDTISSKDVELVENNLTKYSVLAKSNTAHLVAHAHIDMNWMWGYQETSAVVLDTLRTMLTFMEDFPEFTFSQSQASVYQIVERFDKDMLEEIKKRIKEGRWEVSSSTWVEHDKNMSSFEAQIRQVLYTKNYLSNLLNININSLNIDFEPDTFGHSENIPEILSKAGIKYYYHCRGYVDEQIYNWTSPGGGNLLVYREPKWYNADIEPFILSDMPLMTSKYGLNDILLVYGVGDHGGGPTRRDITSIIDMMSWPLYPRMIFSSYEKFFNSIEKYKDKLPQKTGELNFVFTGCYTTQSRIKRANKFAESRLYDSEVITSGIYEFLGNKPEMSSYQKAWENTLFNQFHDILPGSGMNDTREYALGLFQETLALSNNEEQKAIRSLCKQIDTSDYIQDFEKDGGESEGAGVGYSISHVQGYMFSQTERGTGSTRISHVFNTTPYDREEAFDIIIFDYHSPKNLIEVFDGEEVINSCVTEDKQYYWKHIVTKVTILAKIPAFSYKTYIIRQKEDDSDVSFYENEIHRVHNIGDMPVVLENDLVRAEFNKTDMTLNSFIDKRTNTNLVKPGSACFELIYESNKRGESSWIVSEFMSLKSINKEYNVKYLESSNHPYKSYLKYRVEFEKSNIEATINLRPNSTTIDFDIWVNWVEGGSRDTYIPQLRFSIDAVSDIKQYLYDIPMGIITRDELAFDVPACTFQFAKVNNSGLAIYSAEKYGFRGYNSKMSLDLLRSSFDPDPYPELGRHQIKFSFGSSINVQETLKTSNRINHPLISFPGKPGIKGNLPLSDYFFNSNTDISCIKLSEDNTGIIVRLLNIYDKDIVSKFITRKSIKAAYLCDACENTISDLSFNENSIELPISHNSFETIKIQF